MNLRACGAVAVSAALFFSPASLIAEQVTSNDDAVSIVTAQDDSAEPDSGSQSEPIASDSPTSSSAPNEPGGATEDADTASDSEEPASEEQTAVPSDGSEAVALLSNTPSISNAHELKPLTTSKAVTTVGGPTRYETSALQALDGWSHSDWVIVASGEAYADSICSAGLAGALECPILLTPRDGLSSVISDAVTKLGAKHAIVLGGPDVISDQVCSQLKGLTGSSVTRLWGATRFETQLEVYKFGLSNRLWGSDAAIVASGMNFADALAVSPLAYKLKAPVFYATDGGSLPDGQEASLSKSGYKKFVVTGGTVVVSDGAVSWLKSLGHVTRLGGATRYETSAQIAAYGVSNLGMTWDGMAFTSGEAPYDSLGGGALQGSRNTVLVLKNVGDSTGASLPSGAKAAHYRYFGGSAIYPGSFKVLMAKKSGIDPSQIDGVSCSSNGNWYTIDGGRYLWTGSDWKRGWANDGSSRFFDCGTGQMATGWKNIDGQYCEFDSNGGWITSHYHNIEWAGQPNNYYCGPTSGYMVLRNVGAWRSASGDSLSINKVAQYMHTDDYGYTSFADRWFIRGMNNWLGRDVYTATHAPSYETVRNAIMGSYVNGYATVLDEQERRGGPHFNGHSNGTYAHLMVVDGYDQKSDAVYICDPGAVPYVWPSASRKFWYGSLRTFVQTYMQSDLPGNPEVVSVQYARY